MRFGANYVDWFGLEIESAFGLLFGETIQLCGTQRRRDLLVIIFKLVYMWHFLCTFWIPDGLVAFA
jgi:hypothetical protein